MSKTASPEVIKLLVPAVRSKIELFTKELVHAQYIFVGNDSASKELSNTFCATKQGGFGFSFFPGYLEKGFETDGSCKNFL